MQAYTEILPPTAVTHAVNVPLTDPNAQNVVIAKTSLLQIFEILDLSARDHVEIKGVDDASRRASTTSPTDGPLGRVPDRKLALIAEFPLPGIVTSLAGIKVKDTKSGGHALLVAFKNAKISLLEWDPEQHSLSTVSVHYYESEDLQSAPWAQDLSECSSFLTVDPGSRCAALKFSTRHLAILPFKQSGDDLVMGDYDPDLDTPPQSAVEAPKVNGESTRNETPYSASFVLPLTVLDPALIYPIDLAFLHEYREPTLGILSSSRLPSLSLLEKRKDTLSYSVITLDLEQRARTPLLSVTGLPYDLFQIKSLPAPIGGVLLIGGNEIIHVDQAGKPNAIAVNEFAKQCSNFTMTDQSGLQLRLEGCTIEQLSADTGETLIVLASGELAILSFNLDGRSVSGLSIHKVSAERGGNPLAAPAACIVKAETDTLFIGSLECDALLVSYHRKTQQLSRKRSHAEMLGLEDENVSDEDISEDDDDLYGDSGATNNQSSGRSGSTAAEMYFTIHDRLQNLAPSGKIIAGTHNGLEKIQEARDDFDIVMPTGRGFDGRLSLLTKGMTFEDMENLGLEGIQNVFSVTSTSSDDKDSAAPSLSKFVVTSQISHDGQESSSIYSVTSNGLELLTDTDLQTEYMTTNIHAVLGGKRLVQVSQSDLRSLEPDLKLVQMIPLENDDGQELNVVHTSFVDPYLLVIRDDASAVVFKADKEGEYEEMDDLTELKLANWVSGCLYRTQSSEDILLYLLSTEGALHVLTLEGPGNKNQSFVTANLSSLPAILSADPLSRRTFAKANLTEILVADIGDEVTHSPYLIVRTEHGNVIIYEPFHVPTLEGPLLTANRRWSKVIDVPVDRAEQSNDHGFTQNIAMKQIEKINDLSVVFVPGITSYLLAKNASSSIRAIQLPRESTRAMDSFSSVSRERGVISVNSTGGLETGSFPKNTTFAGNGWTVRHVGLGQDVSNCCHHVDQNLFVFVADELIDFQLPEDERHKEWQDESSSFKPKVTQSSVKLFTPLNDSIIDNYVFEEYEQVIDIQILNLVVSEITNERKNLVVVSTALPKGEALNCSGSIYVFDIIDVVPHPERPETNKKLRLMVREEVKAPVTAIAEIGDEGFLGGTQGSKCIVRGLKEDNTLLPVAFLDLQCYATVLKTLKGAGGVGMALIGDVAKGLWLTGYAPEPYRMMLLGKSRSTMDVVSAEFLPYGKDLYLVMIDINCDIHILQYNPEDAQSLQGQRLLNRTTFHSGHFVSSMSLLRGPPVDIPADIDEEDEMSFSNHQTHRVIISSTSGAIHLLTPLDETTYRRLGALQNHLTAILDQTAGLNPKAYRAVESDGFGSRGMLDGDVLRRWASLAVQRKMEACGRVGAESWEVRKDLERIASI